MKTQNKLIIFLTAIFVTYILFFSGFIYYSLSNYSYTDFYKRLEIRAVTAAKIELENAQDINAIKDIRQEFLEILPNEKIIIIDLENSLKKSDIKKYGISQGFMNELLENGRAYYRKDNNYYSGITYTVEERKYIIIASAENYYSSHHTVYLRNLLIVGLLTSCLIIFFISYLFSRKVLLPVKRIVRNMKNISTENLNLRLQIPENNEELKEICISFNDMLNRLETSFETQRNFVSNASHELNTPLTSIIGEADVILSKERDPAEYVKSLHIILEEAEKLNKKTKALLFLAQTGYNGKVQDFSLVRVDQLIIDVKETVERVYADAKIQLDFKLLPENPDKLKVMANEQLLHLALFNIVMNGCKYSNRQKVKIAIGISFENAIIIVEDKGIGIPQKELDFIYDPFFRASNTLNYDGYGIGLPLTRNIIVMHKGTLRVNSSENEGTVVEIKIPLPFLTKV
tara:strand:+ start:2069 stop:3442 length:1374 start_codon:yes stop_codon:yes gene_type:complete